MSAPHHCSPSDYLAMLSWLRSVEAGDASPVHVDWRTRCGVIATMLENALATCGPSAMTREHAEHLWEELGGDLCICQRPDVPHWCEKCQGRLDTIQAFIKSRWQTLEDYGAGNG